jgi:hypothetical protein
MLLTGEILLLGHLLDLLIQGILDPELKQLTPTLRRNPSHSDNLSKLTKKPSFNGGFPFPSMTVSPARKSSAPSIPGIIPQIEVSGTYGRRLKTLDVPLSSQLLECNAAAEWRWRVPLYPVMIAYLVSRALPFSSYCCVLMISKLEHFVCCSCPTRRPDRSEQRLKKDRGNISLEPTEPNR